MTKKDTDSFGQQIEQREEMRRKRKTASRVML